MSPRVQAASCAERAGPSAAWRVAAVCAIGFAVSGCMATGPQLASIAADTSLTTGSIAPEPARTESEDGRFSDEMTIRNAVSSADPSEFDDNALAWTNAATGSRGVISSMTETQADKGRCRNFTTTLERYDGVALYRGETCLGPQGYWTMEEFDGA